MLVDILAGVGVDGVVLNFLLGIDVRIDMLLDFVLLDLFCQIINFTKSMNGEKTIHKNIS